MGMIASSSNLRKGLATFFLGKVKEIEINGTNNRFVPAKNKILIHKNRFISMLQLLLIESDMENKNEH